MKDASSSTLKHVQPWASHALLSASVSRLSKPLLDGGSLRAAHGTSARSCPQGSSHGHSNGRPRKHGPLVPGDLTLPRTGRLQEALVAGMGTGSGHTRGHS